MSSRTPSNRKPPPRPKTFPLNSPNSQFSLSSYAYDLPEQLVAQHPAKKRDQARLMVVDRRRRMVCHDVFKNLGRYLPPRSVLVLNNSKVVPARLLGRRPTGGEVEIFLLKDLGDGQSFEALLNPLKRVREGEVIELEGGIRAVLTDKERRTVRFNKKNILRHLKDIGRIPLPPYIKRDDGPADKKDYQTVYAKRLGSVASPTAGLHFTKPLISALKKKAHAFKELTLHINYGTFKPVVCEDIRGHQMHVEAYELSAAAHKGLLQAKGRGRKVVAVGTTSCRVLESVARTGRLNGETDIFLYPGQEFKMADLLLTNFHLPHSTLLMLVCAFGGHDLIMRAYREAIQQQYRFYSYGDAMLIT